MSANTTDASLTREQVENLARRSYQYVAMFNVIKKFALDPSAGVMFTNGFNKPRAMTTLVDHTARRLRPNNDTLYQGAVLDPASRPGDH